MADIKRIKKLIAIDADPKKVLLEVSDKLSELETKSEAGLERIQEELELQEQEIDHKIDVKLKQLEEGTQEEMLQRISEVEQETEEKIEKKFNEISLRHGEDGNDGEDGKDADEEKIIASVLSQLPTSRDGLDADEEAIIASVVEKLPEIQDGKAPDHEWNGTFLRFRKPDGEWGQWMNLQGESGKGGKRIGPYGGRSIKVSDDGVLSGIQVKELDFLTGFDVTGDNDNADISVNVSEMVDLLDGDFLLLDGSNDPITGNIEIQVTDGDAFVVSNALGAIEYFKINTNTTNPGALLQITDDVLGADFLSIRGADHGLELMATTVDTAIANLTHNTWQLDIDNTALSSTVYRGLLYNLNVNEDFDITGSIQGVFFAALNNGTGTIDSIIGSTAFLFNLSTGILTEAVGYDAVMGLLGGTVTDYTAFNVSSSIGTITNAHILGDSDTRFITNSCFNYNRGGTKKFVPISEEATGITFDSLDLVLETTTAGDVFITSVDDVIITADLIDVIGTMKTDARILKITEVTTATYAVLATDHHISIQYTLTAAQTTTLPAITADNHGQVYHLKDADYNAAVNNITINTTGADTLNGQPSGLVNGSGDSLTLIANNSTKDWELQ